MRSMRKIVNPEEKKRQEARFAVKVMPLVTAFAVAFLVVDAVNLARHPDMPHLLHLMTPAGECYTPWHFGGEGFSF